jgi:hypothetical protein
MGLKCLKSLQPPVPVRRHHLARLGVMIHVDITHLSRFECVVHPITVDWRLSSSSAGVGYDNAYAAIDDATRVASTQALPDQKQGTTVGFLIGALALGLQPSAPSTTFYEATSRPNDL